MCRAGGRRCPGQYDPAKAAARNAQRRAQRAAAREEVSSRDSSTGAHGSAPHESEVGSGGISSVNSPDQVSTSSEVALPSGNGGGAGSSSSASLSSKAPKSVQGLLSATEKATTSLEARGEIEAARTLRVGVAELMQATPVRASALYACYEHRAAEALHGGKVEEARACSALMEVSLDATSVREGKESRYLTEIMESVAGADVERDLFMARRERLLDLYGESVELRERERSRFTLKPFTPGERDSGIPGGGESGDVPGYTGGELLDGRSADGTPIPEAHRRGLAAELDAVMREGSERLVEMMYSRGEAPSRFGPPEPPDGFRRVGTGVESLVYLQESTGLVYKVPHRENAAMRNREGLTLAELERAVQEEYAAVDDGALRAHGVENLRTAFLRVPTELDEPCPVQVQPYCSPGEWHGMWLSDEARGELEGLGMADLLESNVLVNPSTGQVRLIDCLPVDRGESS